MRPIGTETGLLDLDLSDRPAVLCDLDGCLISGSHVHPGAAELVEACGERLWIVSNNSADTAATLAQRLAALGMDVAPDRIVLAGEETVRHLARKHGRPRVAMHADAPLRDMARAVGIVVCDQDPEILLLGRDARFSLTALEEIVAQLFEGAEFWVTNLDTTHPGADGLPVPETGALLAAVRACCGPIPVHCLGKPAPDLIEIALERSGASAHAAVFLGDNVATDGEAARAAGVEFIRIAHAFVGARAKDDLRAAASGRLSC